MRTKLTLICFLYLVVSNINAQTLERLWTASFNGQGDFSDRYTCSATDTEGDIIVAGSTSMPDQNRNLLIRKLSPDGSVLWTQTFDGPGGGADEILSLVTDSDNNVYITGFQKGSGAGNDFITQKYSTNGDLLWSSVYNFNSNQYDQANSIALGSGYVVVTGQSDNDPTSGNNDDYVTIKYNISDGSEMWIQRYNGLGNAQDRPVKVLTDAAGNVYVTGTSDNGSNFDFVTLKYSVAGELLWVKYGDRGDTDRATDMILDSSGNLYVTGRSQNTSNNYDYYTLKYNSGGVEQWVNVYDYVDDDRPNRLAIDLLGNILVTGQSDQNFTALTNYDIATIKINNANGTLLWAQRYSGSANDTDEGVALWCDATGNIYVGGQTDTNSDPLIDNYNWLLLKYSPTGTQIWQRPINISNSDILYNITANEDQIYLCGYTQVTNSNRNAIAVKLNSLGDTVWTNSEDGPGDNGDNVRAIAANNNTSFYTAGYSVSFYQDRNMLISKRNAADGNLQWTYQLNGSSPGSVDEAVALKVDNNGNVIAAGYTKNSGTSSDFTTVKLNANGDSLWVQIYNGAASESDRAADLDIDASGNVYVTGRTDADASILTNDNYLTIKYNPAGIEQWVRIFSGAAGGEDRAYKVRVSNTGTIYVVGKQWNGSDFDITIIGYSPTGVQNWTYTYPDAGGDEIPKDADIDANGNLYVTGYAAGIYQSALTFALNASGNLIWDRLSGANGYNRSAEAITVDSNNRIYVATNGFYQINGSMENGVYALLYSNTGILIDTLGNAFSNPTPNSIIADDIIVDPNGYVYMATHADENSALLNNYKWHIYLVKPGEIFTDIWAGSADSTDVPNAMLLLGNKLIVAGSTWDNNEQRNMQFIAYDATASGTTVEPLNQQQHLILYPNPSNSILTINNSNISANSLARPTCKVYTLLGQEVSVAKLSETPNQLIIDVGNLSSGMYLLDYNGIKGKFSIVK